MIEIDRSTGLSPAGRVALGAWIGTSAAMAIVVTFTLLIDSYADSLPHRDTDMFGRPEGWFFLFVILLIGPPLCVLSGVVGFVAARSRFPLDQARGSVKVYLAAFLVGAFAGSAVAGRVGGIALVLIALSVASPAAAYYAHWRAERQFDEAIARARRV